MARPVGLTHVDDPVVGRWWDNEAGSINYTIWGTLFVTQSSSLFLLMKLPLFISNVSIFFTNA